ncbi:MAG: hypothetical protein NVS2B4_00350 [Ramlibacter sp.]
MPTPKLPVTRPPAIDPLWRHQLGLLLEWTGEGIFGIDLAGQCMFINRAGARLLGWDAAAVLGRNVDEASCFVLLTDGHEGATGYTPGGVAKTVINTLPRRRTRASLHHLPGYYELRNHIVDFLVTRADAGAP